jgi:hypothetical protein
MHQWVAAICQASIQYLQISTPPLPYRTLDKSVPRIARNVPAPIASGSDIYDDAGSEIKCDRQSEDIYDLCQSCEEEELYDDVSDVYLGKSSLDSKPNAEVKPIEKSPPLPPRRPLITVPQDNLSDHDLVYDDVCVTQCKEYSNMADIGVEGGLKEVQPRAEGQREVHPGVNEGAEKRQRGVLQGISVSTEKRHTEVLPGISVDTEKKQRDILPGVNIIGAKERHTKVEPTVGIGQTRAQSQQSVKPKVQYEEEEELYDDIGAPEELSMATKLPVLQQTNSVGNGGTVKNRIKQLQASLPKGNMLFGGHHPDSKISNQIQPNISTLHKLVRNSGEGRISSLSQAPTDNHNPKSKPNKSNLQKFSSPETPLSPQPPELPPRTYIKR